MRQTDKEYAYALFELSQEEGTVDAALSELLTVKEAVCGEPEFIELLRSPAIPLRERLQVIDETFSAVLSEYTLSFLKVLCEAGRIDILTDCICEFEGLVKAYSGKVTATVICAAPLSEKQKAELKEKLEKAEKRQIDPVFRVDPTLIGGLIVEIEGKVYDGSVRSRLRDVKDVMIG
ncbi:MAG: ATP synthase F1 subunit delta [Clostridia bacterium]|nr:ATP synthase F1 subunit delta [Clostridia bacterium]